MDSHTHGHGNVVQCLARVYELNRTCFH